MRPLRRRSSPIPRFTLLHVHGNEGRRKDGLDHSRSNYNRSWLFSRVSNYEDIWIRKEPFEAKEQPNATKVRSQQIQPCRFLSTKIARWRSVRYCLLGYQQRKEEILRFEMHFQVRDSQVQAWKSLEELKGSPGNCSVSLHDGVHPIFQRQSIHLLPHWVH